MLSSSDIIKNMYKTLLIIPAFNEEKNIYQIISRINGLYPEFHLAVINDGSCDNTVREVRKTSAILINHPFNMGYGVAIQTGYKFAYENGYDFLIQMDGDGQHDPSSVREIYNRLITSQADLVLGSRFFLNSKYHASLERRVGIKLFSFIVNRLTNLNLNDVTTGFQGMNRKVLELFIKDSFPFDYPDADVIVMANKQGVRIAEVPVVMYRNQTGKSMHSNPVKNILYTIQMFISLSVVLIQKERREGR